MQTASVAWVDTDRVAFWPCLACGKLSSFDTRADSVSVLLIIRCYSAGFRVTSLFFGGEHKCFYFQLLHSDILYHTPFLRSIICSDGYLKLCSPYPSWVYFKSCSFYKLHTARPPSSAGYSRLVLTLFLCDPWGDCSNSVCLSDHSRSKLLDADHFTAALRGPHWLKERRRKQIRNMNYLQILPKSFTFLFHWNDFSNYKQKDFQIIF